MPAAAKGLWAVPRPSAVPCPSAVPRPLVLGAVLAVLLATLVGCGHANPPMDPTPTRLPNPAPPSITFAPCQGLDGGGGAAVGHRFCGQLDVIDSRGSSRTLQVLLVSDREADPLSDRSVLVYHPGGPGISPVELTAQDPPEIDLSRFVVLAWDGTTSSSDPGACGPESVAFGTNRVVAELGRRATAVGEECRFGFGGPADIGAIAAAEELEAIRGALSVDQLDMLAISYGTAIAEAYLRTHPGHVRRAVLDAPIGIEVSWRDRIAAVGHALAEGANRLAGACDTPGCLELASGGATLSYPLIRRAVLERDPTVGSGALNLTGTMLDQATLLALRSTDSWSAWATAVDAALVGDGTALWALGEKEYFDLDRAVFYRSLCADIDRPTDPAAYGAPADEFLVAYTSALAPCSAFPHRDLPAPIAGPGTSTPEVLLISSSHDVLTPAALLDAAPVLRAQGELCVTDVIGHTSYRAPGIAELVSEFLAGRNVEAASERCAGG